jgi:GNAT superfamily N-acetyltransferase
MPTDSPAPLPLLERRRDGYLVSTDPALLDADAIHAYLRRSYWAAKRPRDVVRRSLEHSLCFGLYCEGRQVGLARVVTDYATFAYLCDVYVLEEHRGRGLGVWLMECVMSYPKLQGLRRFLLFTADAHELYRRFGFAPTTIPERLMEILDPNV